MEDTSGIDRDVSTTKRAVKLGGNNLSVGFIVHIGRKCDSTFAARSGRVRSLALNLT